jgi:DNA-binding transcriptional ArsR family regulator
MTVVLQLGDGDVQRCRFASSPLWETLSALRALAAPGPDDAGRRAWRETAGASLDLAELEALVTVTRGRGYVPDFLSPPPSSPRPGFAEQLAEVRATPAPRVCAELSRCRANPGAEASAPVLERLLADPGAATQQLADQIERVWDAAMRPLWPRLEALIAADIDHRSHRLADQGLQRVVEDLHPSIRWRGTTIRIAGPVAESRRLAGEGLVLMPSIFSWPGVVAIVDPPWQPTIVYPARGVAELWSGAPAAPVALARLLGTARAGLLAALDAPASTSALAARLGRSPGGVSTHLAILRDAGLTSRQRHGHEARHARTPLGDAVFRGPS